MLLTTLAAGAAGGPLAALAPVGTSAPIAICSLHVAMTHIRGSEGAGQTRYRLTVKSTGTIACELQNQPSLTLLGKSGRSLPTHVHWTGKLKSLTVRPETTVAARLRFSPDIPGSGEPQQGRCEPEAESVRVDFKNLGPRAHAPVHPGPVRPPTSVCEQGRISASSLR